MKAPTLIAETSLAGELGHRFLVPEDLMGQEQLVRRFVSEAVSHLAGGNFLAVTRKVQQTLENGTVRDGTEILVLIGVDVGRLSVSDYINCQRSLFHRLEDMNRLVTGTIEWRRAESSLLVPCPSMERWIQEDAFDRLPATSVDDGPDSTISDKRPDQTNQGATTPSRVAPALGSLLCGILLGGVVAWVVIQAVGTHVPQSVSKVVDDRTPPTGPSGKPSIGAKQDRPAVSLAAAEEEARQFADQYVSLIRDGKVFEAGRHLARCSDHLKAAESIERLRPQFNRTVVEIVGLQVHGLPASSQQARLLLNQFRGDKNVFDLLTADTRDALESFSRDIANSEDKCLYNLIIDAELSRKAQAIEAYLSKSPLKIMKNSVETYARWLTGNAQAQVRLYIRLTPNVNTGVNVPGRYRISVVLPDQGRVSTPDMSGNEPYIATIDSKCTGTPDQAIPMQCILEYHPTLPLGSSPYSTIATDQRAIPLGRLNGVTIPNTLVARCVR